MKREIADKWVEALRSRKYKQGDGCLRNGDNFCCLGVLCDISGLGKWEKSDHYDNGLFYCGTNAVLPGSVMDWSGINHFKGLFKTDEGDGVCLTSLNDSGMSFAEIADVIEKHWEQL